MNLRPAACALVAAAALSTLALPAHAVPVVYTGSMLGSSEVPPVATTGSGTVIVTVDAAASTMQVDALFINLIGNTTAAHIHCCTAAPMAGNAGVATTTPNFPGFPTGVTSGSYHQSFDMTLASSYNAAFITANGGTPTSAFAALVAGLDNGRAYFNVHTSYVPSGEIRALLSPVPEPASAALLLAGLAGVGLLARRSRSARLAGNAAESRSR